MIKTEFTNSLYSFRFFWCWNKKVDLIFRFLKFITVHIHSIQWLPFRQTFFLFFEPAEILFSVYGHDDWSLGAEKERIRSENRKLGRLILPWIFFQKKKGGWLPNGSKYI